MCHWQTVTLDFPVVLVPQVVSPCPWETWTTHRVTSSSTTESVTWTQADSTSPPRSPSAPSQSWSNIIHVCSSVHMCLTQICQVIHKRHKKQFSHSVYESSNVVWLKSDICLSSSAQERPMDYALAWWSHVKPESLRSPGGRMSGKCPVSLSNWSVDWGKGSLVKYGWVRSALIPNLSWVYFLKLRFSVKDWATKFIRWINIKHICKYFQGTLLGTPI